VCLAIENSLNVFRLYKYKDIDIEDRKKIEVKNRGRRTKKREKKIRGGCVIGDKKGLGSFLEFYCFEIIGSFGWKEMQEYKVSFHFKPVVVGYITLLTCRWFLQDCYECLS
jgi:hypothetical protein